MRRFLPSFCLLIATSVSLAQPATPSGAEPLALVGVNVIAMDRERALPDHTIVVRGGRIVAFGPTAEVKPPADARQIDARGKFVVPGLAEMHGHLAGEDQSLNERILLLNVLHGVTTVRVMQGHLAHLQLRTRVQRGEVIGPHLYIAAPQLSGNSAPTAEAAIKAVTQAKQQGFDLLKIQEGLTLPAFEAIVQTAGKLSLPMAGHVPAEVGLRRALQARFSTIDHLDGYVEALVNTDANADLANAGLFGSALIDRVDESRIPEIARATQSAGTAMVPTETVAWNLLTPEPLDKLLSQPEFKYLPQTMVQGWERQKRVLSQAGLTAAQLERYQKVRRTLIKALFDAGVPILLGSDAPQVLNVPGVAVHAELERMVAAGLTPYQALVSGTREVAKHFGTLADSGSIANGKHADLLVLEGNPLENIANTRKTFGVLNAGRWWPRAEIDKRLNELSGAGRTEREIRSSRLAMNGR